MHILSRSIVHASLALFCLLQILLGGCLGLHSLSRHTVHASWSFFCLLQIPLGGPSCRQGCSCSNTLAAGSICRKVNCNWLQQCKLNLVLLQFLQTLFSSKRSLHPVTYMSSYTQMIFTTCLHHSFSSFSCCVSF